MKNNKSSKTTSKSNNSKGDKVRCMKCKGPVMCMNIKKTMTKNKRCLGRGTCPKCGCKVTKFFSTSDCK